MGNEIHRLDIYQGLNCHSSCNVDLDGDFAYLNQYLCQDFPSFYFAWGDNIECIFTNYLFVVDHCDKLLVLCQITFYFLVIFSEQLKQLRHENDNIFTLKLQLVIKTCSQFKKPCHKSASKRPVIKMIFIITLVQGCLIITCHINTVAV